MKKIITLTIVLILIIMALCGCADAAKNEIDYESKTFSEEILQDDVIDTSRKLQKEVSLSVETKEYDEYIDNMRENVVSNGGYIEASDESIDYKFRTFNATVRIPVDKTDKFTNFASNNATVTNRSESVKDVTEEYVDIEARIKVFKAEEESLIEIMKKADNITDLLAVKEQLADLRAEIESYTAQLKSLENKTSYSTITLTVYEVEREAKSEGYWSTIWNNIIKGFKNVGKIISTLFAFALSAIPYLVIPTVIVIAVIILVRILIKKKRLNKNK